MVVHFSLDLHRVMHLFMNEVCMWALLYDPNVNGSKMAPTEMAAILLTGPMDLTYRESSS